MSGLIIVFGVCRGVPLGILIDAILGVPLGLVFGWQAALQGVGIFHVAILLVVLWCCCTVTHYMSSKAFCSYVLWGMALWPLCLLYPYGPMACLLCLMEWCQKCRRSRSNNKKRTDSSRTLPS